MVTKPLGAIRSLLPWIVFLSMLQLWHLPFTLCALVALFCVLFFTWKQLRAFYLLDISAAIFFGLLAILAPLQANHFVADHIVLLAAVIFACVMWASIAIRRPFALAYIQEWLGADSDASRPAYYISILLGTAFFLISLSLVMKVAMPTTTSIWINYIPLMLLSAALIVSVAYVKRLALRNKKIVQQPIKESVEKTATLCESALQALLGEGVEVDTAIFIPNKNAESPEDGFLLLFSHDPQVNTHEFTLVNTRTLDAEPLAFGKISKRLPEALRGSWFTN